MDRFLAIFTIGQENFKTLLARIADKVIGGHMSILQSQAWVRQEAVWYNCPHV
jgi:hypothetical protein